MFDENDEQLRSVFKYFSSKRDSTFSLTEDVTLNLGELLNLFTKAEIIGGKSNSAPLTVDELIKVAERYHCVGETRLEDKLADDKFTAYLKANPLALPVNQEIAAWK